MLRKFNKRILAMFLATTMAALTVATMLSASAAIPTNMTGAYKWGDVDGDGKITISDSLEILKYLQGMDNAITRGINRGDLRPYDAARITTPSGAIKQVDSEEIQKYLAKMSGILFGHYKHWNA